MSEPLVVLKFGGSVLLDENRLRIAVHEIYRWRREGNRVLAVVSALAGRTEQLIARCDALSPGASAQAKAALIASGELESASLLGVHLDRAGIPARVLTPAAVGMVAAGNALDADPVGIDRGPIDRSLEEEGVLVFPGFVAVNEGGELVTLGRGGSDLTAVYLAHALGATRCRLIKDVDGLYERDPAAAYPPPRRFAYASYADAARTDGSIIQHKAIRFAERAGLEIELGRFNGTRPTRIGAGASVFAQMADAPVVLEIALCGLGTVGGGVLELAAQLPELFRVVGAACRRPERCAHLLPLAGTITDDAAELAGCGADVVVEAIGGVDAAFEVARRALGAGSRVVTANKALIAAQGDELETLGGGEPIRASASVGGVAPVLEAVSGGEVMSVRGVLNGTGNFVLGALARGVPLAEAVAEAQRLGFAEADPSRDLDGRDALDKLLVIARTLGWSIDPAKIVLEPITAASAAGAVWGGTVRHVATLTAGGAGVRVEAVGPGDALAGLENEWNAAVLTFADGSTRVVRGKGAGRWPTSEAVFADLLECSRTGAVRDAELEETCV